MYVWRQTCGAFDYYYKMKRKKKGFLAGNETSGPKKTCEASFFGTTLLLFVFFLSRCLHGCLMWRWVTGSSLVQHNVAACHFELSWLWTKQQLIGFCPTTWPVALLVLIWRLHTSYVKYIMIMWPCLKLSTDTVRKAGSRNTIYCMGLLTRIDIRTHLPQLRS